MIMKKLLGLGFAAAMFAGQAHAGFISMVTGSDMAGISVTVMLDDNSTETLVWSSIDATTGGVSGTLGIDGWSLVESGDTLGGFDGQSLFGVWTLANNTGQAIKSLFVDLSATSVVFDTLFFDASANGSLAGREFTYDTRIATVSPVFSMNYMDELFKGLTLTAGGQQQGLLADGSSFEFMIDTDIVAVPAPAALSLMGLSLLGLALRSRRKQA
tara:strand:- start:155 stop:796 length:642 start_codon:yes stop_codon:yes gene_type:complete